MQNLIFYSPDQINGAYTKLMGIIEQTIPLNQVTVCHTIDKLSSQIRDFHSKYKVAVFAPSNFQELDQLKQRFDELKHLDIILIIPNENQKTLSTAAQLYPRYFTTLQSCVGDIASVLHRIIHRSEIRENQYIKENSG